MYTKSKRIFYIIGAVFSSYSCFSASVIIQYPIIHYTINSTSFNFSFQPSSSGCHLTTSFAVGLSSILFKRLYRIKLLCSTVLLNIHLRALDFKYVK